MTTIHDVLSPVEDFLEEELEKAYELANIGAAIIWMAREHVEAHATPEIKQYFQAAVEKFLPICHDVMSVDPATDGSMVPDFLPSAEPSLVASWLKHDFYRSPQIKTENRWEVESE